MFTFFFFNDTATTEIYTLSLHDALPISADHDRCRSRARTCQQPGDGKDQPASDHGQSSGRRAPPDDGGQPVRAGDDPERSEEHTSELQSRQYLVCRLLLEKKKISLRHTP